MTERLHFHFSFSCIGERNGNPLQCSCLENPRDRGACWAAIHWVAKSRTRLKRLSSSSSSSSSSDLKRRENKLTYTDKQEAMRRQWQSQSYAPMKQDSPKARIGKKRRKRFSLKVFRQSLVLLTWIVFCLKPLILGSFGMEALRNILIRSSLFSLCACVLSHLSCV